ncbi:hypothetical protein PPACK8108_LOCUS4235, partial [Phakopsora pachyrhizi]
LITKAVLVTGCSNSIWSKFQDKQCVANCDNPDVLTHKYFEQPVWQTLNMFIGEFHLINWFKRNYNKVRIENSRKGYRCSSISNESRESVDEQENKAENERRRSSSFLLPDQLVRPSHLSKLHGPSTNPPLLAVHGPVPVPLTTSIEPDQLVDRPEPGVQNLTGLQKMVFCLPTMFDICGTTLMNSGLLFVPVSVFQMVRGALPLWL